MHAACSAARTTARLSSPSLRSVPTDGFPRVASTNAASERNSVPEGVKEHLVERVGSRNEKSWYRRMGDFLRPFYAADFGASRQSAGRRKALLQTVYSSCISRYQTVLVTTSKDFGKLGFKVRGIGGWKGLRQENTYWRILLSAVTQKWVFFFHGQALGLFATKRL